MTVTGTTTAVPARKSGRGEVMAHDEGMQDDVTAIHQEEEEEEAEEDHGHKDEILGGVFGVLGGVGVAAGGVALARRLRKRTRTPQIPEVSFKSESKLIYSIVCHLQCNITYFMQICNSVTFLSHEK